MKRIYLLLIVLALGLFFITAAPNPNKEVVYFSGYYDQVTIHLGQVGVYRLSYVNCSYGLSLDWTAATQQHFTIRKDGAVIGQISAEQAAARGEWSEPYVVDYEWDGRPVREWCAWPAANAWRVNWVHRKLQFDKPGVYELDVHMEITEPLIDGFAHFTPPLDIYDAGVWFDKTIVITVE